MPQFVEVTNNDIDFNIVPRDLNLSVNNIHPLNDRGPPREGDSLHWFADTVLATQDYQLSTSMKDLFNDHSKLVSAVPISFLKEAVKNYEAGHIRHFVKNWEYLTSDREIISVVKYGLKLNTLSAIPPRKPFQYKLSAEESKTIDKEIIKMLQKMHHRII